MGGIDDIISKDTSKTDYSKAIEMLFNNEYKWRKTILRKRSISTFTTLNEIAQLYDIVWLKSWLNDYAELLTSGDGQGRKDIVEITKYSIDKQNQMNEMLLNAMRR